MKEKESRKQKVDTRVLKTRARLIQALSELTKERDLSEVSVSELCKKAGVTRTTFYKYYNVPSDISRESFERHIREIMVEINRPGGSALYDTMLYCCKEFQKNYLITKQIFPGFTISDERLREFYTNLRNPALLGEDSRIFFISGGSAAVVNNWLKHHPSVPPETIAKRLTAYIQTVLQLPKE